MSGPKFSVIIPTYNRSKYCIEAVTSVLNQSYENYEIIVVDDGSTDDTQRHFSNTVYPKTTYIHVENAGVSSARNIGVEKAVGDFICYLDSDDLWHIDKLQELDDFISRHSDIDVIFHDFKKHNVLLPEPFEKSNSDIFPFIYDLYAKYNDTDWLSHKESSFSLALRGYPFYPSTFTIKKHVHDQYRWDKGVLKSEDFNLFLKLTLSYSFAYLDKSLATVRLHDNNKSADTAMKARVTVFTMKAIRDLYCTKPQKKIVDKYLYNFIYGYGVSQIKKGNFTVGISWIFKALSQPKFIASKIKGYNHD